MKEAVFNVLSEHELEKVNGGIATNTLYGIQKWLLEKVAGILSE